MTTATTREQRAEAIESLAHSPDYVLAIPSRTKMVRYHNGRYEQRTSLIYVDGFPVSNPADRLGSWRRSARARGAPTWLKNFEPREAIIVPRTRAAALDILRTRTFSFVLFDDQRRYDCPHFWIEREQADIFASAKTDYGPHYWTRWLCRTYFDRLRHEDNGLLVSPLICAEPSKIHATFVTSIDQTQGRPLMTTPHIVALKRSWTSEPGFGLVDDIYSGSTSARPK